MAQLLLSMNSAHAQINRGDALNAYSDNTIEYGPGCRIGENLIIEIPSLTKQNLIQIITNFRKEYIEITSSIHGVVKTIVINTITTDPESWTEIKRKAKKTANFAQLLDNEEYKKILASCTKQVAFTLLQKVGETCIYKELNELRV